MEKKHYIFVADGGGSKTIGCLFDINGNILAQSRGGPTNLGLGTENAITTIKALYGHVIGQSGIIALKDQVTMVLGLAAQDTPGASAKVIEALSEFAHVHVINDAHMAMLGAHEGKAGVTLTIGTGAIIYAKRSDGIVRQISGIGFPAGDHGSGAWIGFQVFSDFLRAAYDLPILHPQSDALKAIITQHCGQERMEWINFNQKAEPKDYAPLAKTVFELAETNDSYCKHVIECALKEALDLINSALQDEPSLPISINGSVAHGLKEKIKSAKPELNIIEPMGDALHGGYVYAKALLDRETPIIFFGSLRDRDLLEIVLGRALIDNSYKAGKLKGYQLKRANKQLYPVLEIAPDMEIDIMALYGVSEEEEARLQFYETIEYQLSTITAYIEDQPIAARYFEALDHNISASEDDWTFDDWLITAKAAACAEAKIAMEYFGIKDHQEIQDMWPEIEQRVKKLLEE